MTQPSAPRVAPLSLLRVAPRRPVGGMSEGASSTDAASGQVRVKLVRFERSRTDGTMMRLAPGSNRDSSSIECSFNSTVSVKYVRTSLLGVRGKEANLYIATDDVSEHEEGTYPLSIDALATIFKPLLMSGCSLADLHLPGRVTLAHESADRGRLVLTEAERARIWASKIAADISQGAVPVKIARIQLSDNARKVEHPLMVYNELDHAVFIDTSFFELKEMLAQSSRLRDGGRHLQRDGTATPASSFSIWIAPSSSFSPEMSAPDPSDERTRGWQGNRMSLSAFQSAFTLITADHIPMSAAGPIGGEMIVFTDPRVSEFLGSVAERSAADTRPLAQKLLTKRRLREPLVRPGVGLFPDTAVSPKLIPLFEALGVTGVCKLARCNKAWKKTLDAWRATEATDVAIKWTGAPLTFVARKYPQLRTLRAGDLSALDLLPLKACKALRNIECGTVDGPSLIALAQATGQLRSIRIEDGVHHDKALMTLVQACPYLEVLSCDAPTDDRGCGLGFTDESAAPLMERTMLREISLKGGCGFSGAAVNGIIEKCPKLAHLELGWIRKEGEVKQPLPSGLTLVCGTGPLTPESVTLKVHRFLQGTTASYKVKFYKLKRGSPVSTLMHAFCQREGVARDRCRFRYYPPPGINGIPIRGHEMPAELGMQDSEKIEVLISRS